MEQEVKSEAQSGQETLTVDPIATTEIAVAEFVFTGEGDPELAARANTFMTALHNGDATASWDLLKFYQQSLGDDQELWASWAADHQFDSWTVDTANWDGQWWGSVTGVATKGDTTYDYSLIYQLMVGENISENMITDMSFKQKE